MNLFRQIRPLFPLLALTAGAQATLVVNAPQPITKSFLVQIVDTAADNGSNVAPLFGTPTQQQAIFDDVNLIWAQAGIQVQFEFYGSTWNNTFANSGDVGNNNPRPGSDINQITSTAALALHLDSKANQLFMLQIVPSFSQQSTNVTVGFSFTGNNGMTFYAGSSLPGSTAGQEAIASVLAHEIGRNFSLTTDTTDSQNLMNPAFTSPAGDYLTSSQISQARGSSFLTSVPEPSVAACLAGGLILVSYRRFRGAPVA